MRNATSRPLATATCGRTALTAIAAFHGYRLPLADVRETPDTVCPGNAVTEILELAGRAGLKLWRIRATPEALQHISLPAIAQWKESDRDPFVVLYKFTFKGIIVLDPSRGLRCLPITEFHQHWSGVVLLLGPSSGISQFPQQPSSIVNSCGSLLSNRRLTITGGLLAAVLTLLLSPMSSSFIHWLMNSIQVHGRNPAFKWLTLGMSVAPLLRLAFQALRSCLMAHLSLRSDAETVGHSDRLLPELPHYFLRTTKEPRKR